MNAQRQKEEATESMAIILDKPEDIFYITGFGEKVSW